MPRLTGLAVILFLSVLPAFAAPRPPLPEKVNNGDAPPSFPAEAARRAEAAKVLIGKGDLDEASQEIDTALAADPTQPLAYFYRSVIFYRRGDYEKALRDAALGRDELQEIIKNDGKYDGDDEQLQRFKELADAIQTKQESVKALGPQVDPAKKKQEFDDSLRAGDEAYGKGLLAKAAAAYAKAFRADPTKGEIGLRAATLYADRLKNLLEAALLWQQVLAAGEPHATTARAELQSHRDALAELLNSKLAELHNWIVHVVSYVNGVRMGRDPAEALRLAEAFPESMELQVEIALLYAENDDIEETVVHLQSAARLGLSADDFLARKEFIASFARLDLDSAKGRPLAEFVQDAYGDDTLGKIRTELQRRTDEITRVAREKAEKERQARLAAERKDLTAWRDARRLKIVQEVHALISARNGIEVEMAEVKPGKKRTFRIATTRFNSLSRESGKYLFKLWYRYAVVRVSSGIATPTANENLVSLSSFAPLREIVVSPSFWGPSESFLPADPAYRALAKEVRLVFNHPANIHQKQTVTYEYESSDGSTGYSNEYDSNNSVTIEAMLQEGEIARLKEFFQQLAKLDDAGNDLEKLRQLRQ